MRCTTQDGVPIDGCYHGAPGQVALLHVHGKGGNFYSGPSRFVPELTRDQPLAHLAINMRCHDLGYSRWDTYLDGAAAPTAMAGGMWERVSDGHLDLAAAMTFLRERGHTRVFLVGHSSGGFYAVDYAARDSAVTGRILLSPLTSNRAPLAHWFGSDEELEAATRCAEELVASGRGHHLIPFATWYFALSAASLLERLNEPEDFWWDALQSSTAPLLMIWGAGESRDRLWSDFHTRASAPLKACHTVPTADHYYNGFEAEIATAILTFVTAAA